jgi:mRNA interferase MazF
VGRAVVKIRQYDVCIVDLNPAVGSEMRKVRTCVVLSPDEANRYLRTVIVAPVTSRIHRYKFRVQFSIPEIKGEIALDHIRSLDKTRILRIAGTLDSDTIIILKATVKEFLVD